MICAAGALLRVLIYQSVLLFAGLEIDEADVQRDLVVLIESAPELICELVDIAAYSDSLRLPLEGGDGIAVADIGMDEVA